jgi:hypothetical protein
LQVHLFFTINSPLLHGGDPDFAVNIRLRPTGLQENYVMYRTFKTKIVVLAFVSVGLLSAIASAACGDLNKSGAMLHRQSWQGSNALLPGSLLRISTDADLIVGMWHATFTAQGNEIGPPDGTPIDNALVTWHSDGTELMNSARPAQDGDFCMGVWKKTGKSTYKLNHFAWFSNDTANAPGGIGNPTGPANLVEEVTLSADGKHYTGRFSIDAYDLNGTEVTHIVGVIAATRITLDTTVGDLL